MQYKNNIYRIHAEVSIKEQHSTKKIQCSFDVEAPNEQLAKNIVRGYTGRITSIGKIKETKLYINDDGINLER